MVTILMFPEDKTTKFAHPMSVRLHALEYYNLFKHAEAASGLGKI